MSRILIIDDDTTLQCLLSESLSRQYLVRSAFTIEEARSRLDKEAFDLILLDVALPDGDGFKFCAQLRNAEETRDIPIVFFTGNCGVPDKVMGFSLGADDYVTKPFHFDELRVRIDARLKRINDLRAKGRRFHVGNLHIDLDCQRVSMKEGNDELPIETTPLEFKLLYLMARDEGKVFSREQLIEAAWGKGFHITERAVDTHLSNLRKKISASSCAIKSIHGVGYKVVRQGSLTDTR